MCSRARAPARGGPSPRIPPRGGFWGGACRRPWRGAGGGPGPALGGPLGGRYVLEVSSPGLERPLRWHRHWVRFVGRDVQATVAGLGRVRARIVDVPDEHTVVLEPAGRAAQSVRLTDIRDARLAVDW